MDYAPTAPAAVLEPGFHAHAVAQRSWTVDWSHPPDPEQLYQRLAPASIDFSTSGSTGAPQVWRRRREDMWHEAGLLGDLLGEPPEAVVSFAPTVHLFGALGSVILPARLRVPVWYRPGYVGRLPPIVGGRVAVVATPWIFHLLAGNLDWVREQRHVTVLYGGAMLPPTADLLLELAGPERLTVVEVLGSTEAGGVAWRRWSAGEPPPWTLFVDVDFADGAEGATGDATPPNSDRSDVALHVVSPRLASRPGEPAPPSWRSDDIVTVLGPRAFELRGRSGRLAHVNGRRVNLDEAEHLLRDAITCEDLALVPIRDDMLGEHIELIIQPGPDAGVAQQELRHAFDLLAVRPKRVRMVEAIPRSELGKRLAGAATTSATERGGTR